MTTDFLVPNISSDPIAEYAETYLEAGLCPIPVKPRTKKPVHDGWQNLRLTKDDIKNHFAPENNIGIVLGDASHGLVDVDLDTLAAARLAPYFLPDTDFVFGRNSKPASHWVYRVATSQSTVQFRNRSMVLELRSNGGQTVFPGSVHETGEPIEFSNWYQDCLPAIPGATWEHLRACANYIAIGAELLGHWNPGLRHEIALTLSGTLAHRGWEEDEVAALITAVATEAGDDEIDDRLKAVATTYERFRRGEAISGLQGLSKIIGHDTARQIGKWSKDGHIQTVEQSPPLANSNIQWASSSFTTDDDMAKTFSEYNGERLRYCTASGQWYFREVDVYEPVAPATAQGIVSDFVQTANDSLKMDQKIANSTKSRSRINATLELSRSRLDIPADLIDKEPNLVGLRDGRILDLRTRAFCSGSNACAFRRW